MPAWRILARLQFLRIVFNINAHRAFDTDIAILALITLFKQHLAPLTSRVSCRHTELLEDGVVQGLQVLEELAAPEDLEILLPSLHFCKRHFEGTSANRHAPPDPSSARR